MGGRSKVHHLYIYILYIYISRHTDPILDDVDWIPIVYWMIQMRVAKHFVAISCFSPKIYSILFESAFVPSKGRIFGEDSFGVGSLGITKIRSFSGISFSLSITLSWQCTYVYF